VGRTCTVGQFLPETRDITLASLDSSRSLVNVGRPVLWKLGWAVLLISSLEFTVGGIASALTLPDGWVACVGILVAGIAITLYWGAWWNRQKDYFHSVGPEE